MSETRWSFDRGRVIVDGTARQLFVDGAAVKVGGRAFDVLCALATVSGRVVSKSELMDRVWPHLVVEENNLQVQVLMLRRALGSTAIVTVSGRGYRLALERDSAASNSPAVVQPSSNAAALATDDMPALIGRDRLVAQVLGDLAQPSVRLVTLSGPGGAGKTRLAQHVAARSANERAGGSFVVMLASHQQAAQILPALAAALELNDLCADAALRCLREREALVVLDNLEHLRGAEEEVARLLLHCPRVQVLTTTRSILNLRNERVIAVPALGLPASDEIAVVRAAPAVQLFARRAQHAGRPLREADEDWLAAARICRRLDGLPLAIELAAARLAALSTVALEQRLANALPLLVGGAGDADLRQRTMRRSIAWSLDLLEAPAQRLFRRLGVFVGSVSLSAAAAVDPEPAGVVEHLEALLSHHLLQREDDAEGEPRFRMLETVREFACELAASHGELPAHAQAHAQYMSERALELAKPFAEHDPVRGRARYAPDRGNIAAAMQWCLADPQRMTLSATLFVRMRPVWYYSNESHLAEAWFRQLDIASLASELQVAVWLAGATVALELRDREAVIRRADAALESARPAKDPLAIARAELLRARADADSSQADHAFERAAAGFESAHKPAGRAYARWLRLERNVLEGEPGAEAQAIRACRDELAAQGIPWAADSAERLLAWLDVRAARHEEALRRAAHVEAIAAAAENGIGLAEVWHLQARVAAARSQWDTAVRWEHRAIRILIAENEPLDAWRHLRWLAHLHLSRGDLASAAFLFGVEGSKEEEPFIALGTVSAEDRREWQSARADLERLLPLAERERIALQARGLSVEAAVAVSERSLACTM